jgi:putative ABC transport system permease protein
MVDFRSQSTTLENVAGMFDHSLNVAFTDQPEQLAATQISSNLLDLLGTKPLLGRTFLPEEEVRGRHNVVMFSYRVWQRHFGGDPNIINKSINVNGVPRIIVGIMPPGFRFPERDTEIWTPLVISAGDLEARDDRWLTVVGVTKPGVTLDQAQTDARTIASRLEQQYPENRGHSVRLQPLDSFLFGDVKLPLQLLLVATIVILLIVCANVASLMLARGAVRERDMAIRTALGAGRGRLIAQLMTESLLLALTAGVLGALLSLWFVRLLVAYGTSALPQLEEVGIGIDGRALIFVAAVSLITSLLFGLVPAFQASKPNLQETLKEGRRNIVLSGGGRRLFNVLVVTEITLSLILLIGAGLLLRSFVRLLQVDPGFQPSNVLTMDMTLTGPKYREEPAVAVFFQELMRRVSALPGVQTAGATQSMPLGTGPRYYMAASSQDETDTTNENRPYAAFFQVTPDYFKAIGTPILRGRAFTEQDDKQHPPVAIISERVAQYYFPNQDPIGKNIRLGSPQRWKDWMNIVGVVPDIRFEDLNKTPTMQVYTPHLQGLQVGSSSNRMVLAVRTTGDPSSLTNAVKQQIWSLDKDQPVSMIRTMSQIVSDSLAQRRLIMLLLVVFAVMALVLAVIGLYGTLSYMVTQRRHEIATRMALGAQQRDVLKLIIRQGMVLVIIGVGIGLAAAYLLTRLVASLLYDVSARDPFTFVGVPVLIAVISLMASLIPAYKATKVDPIKVLRDS